MLKFLVRISGRFYCPGLFYRCNEGGSKILYFVYKYFSFKMKSFLLLLIGFTLVIASCSKEEEVVTPPAPNKYTLTITAEAGGTVSSLGGTYNEGSKIAVTATPDTGFYFLGWSNGSSENPLELEVTSNLSLTATFRKRVYAFFEELSDLNKTTSWFQTNANFNKLFLHRSFFNCYVDGLGVTDQCDGNTGYARDTGGYILYDFDKDGSLDLWHHFLKSPWPTNQRGVDIFFNSYNGDNGSYDSIYPSLTQIRKSVLSDFNGDGFKEIMLFSSGYDSDPFPGDSLAIFIPNERRYKFLSKTNYYHGGSTGDLNNDGLVDIYSSADHMEPTLYLNRGGFEFDLYSSCFIDFPEQGPETYTDELFDINLDGRLDIVSGRMLFYQSENGTFNYSDGIHLPINQDNINSTQTPIDYDFFDVNQDGLIDLIVTSEIDFYQGGRLDILIQNSHQEFENKSSEYVDTFIFNGNNVWWKWLYIIDFDDDGDLDLLADGLFGAFFNYDNDLLWWENKDNKYIYHQTKDFYVNQ